jgi:hypothetical protein
VITQSPCIAGHWVVSIYNIITKALKNNLYEEMEKEKKKNCSLRHKEKTSGGSGSLGIVYCEPEM